MAVSFNDVRNREYRETTDLPQLDFTPFFSRVLVV